jgi:hypothetical protein
MGETAKRYNSILEIIDKRLIPDNKARTIRGEVFTPLNLVRQMLFGIRKSSLNKDINEIWGIDKDGNLFDDDDDDRIGGIPLPIWRDPETKWLDPANGIGNFPVVAFYMLDYQLGKHGKKADLKGDNNRVKRRRYIIKNMLYMLELNKGNVNTSRKIFEKIVPGVTANIVCANTLEMTDEKLKREFGVNRFHVIMGNPPFNIGGLKIHGDEDAKTIWPSFVEFSHKHLNNDGILALLHPPQWRVGKIPMYKKVYDILTTNHIIYLKSVEKDKNIDKDNFKFENTDVRFEYYLLQKSQPKGDTFFNDIFGNITKLSIKDLPYIPNAGYSILATLFKKRKILGALDYVDGMKKLKGVKGQVNKITNMSNTHGVDYVVEQSKYQDQEKCKVCTNGETSRWPVYYVDKGSTSEDEQFISPRYILCNNVKHGKKIAEFLSSKIIQFLVFSSHFQIQARTPSILYESLPNITSIDIDFSNDSEIYKYFDIDKSDIEMIDKSKVKRLPVLTDDNLHKERKAAKTAKVEGGAKKRNFTRKLRRT